MPFVRGPIDVSGIPEALAHDAAFNLFDGRISSDNIQRQGVGFGPSLTSARVFMSSGTGSVAQTTSIAGVGAGNFGGVYVTGRFASAGAGTITVTHGLGRVPIGYMEVRADGSGQLFSITTTTATTTGPPLGTSSISANWGPGLAAFSCPVAATRNVAWLFF